MFDLIKDHQLNIMLVLCGACLIMAIMLFITRFLDEKRRKIMICMELIALFLLWFDRQAYIFAGQPGRTAYIMVRVSNFLVFFLTSGIVFEFNRYVQDYLKKEGGLETVPKRLIIVEFISAVGMLLAVVSAITGLYYYFDASNYYHRGRGFLIAYIIPVLCPILQYTVIRQYKKIISRLIYISLVLYIFVPIACGILQIFTYGISIVNMAMVAVSVSLYIFTYLDINAEVTRAHEAEMQDAEGEKKRLQRLFDQTATAFVSAVEKKDDFTKGNSVKVAEYAERIARMSGKSEEDCEKVYYAALLHDVGMIGIPDSVIKNEEDPGKWDYEAIRQKPVIGKEILSSITEYPYLSQGARYSHERYNGTGYPEGLKGEEIPEIARIIAVADAFVTMTSKKRYREARPLFVAREAFVKGAGEEFDPAFANYMVQIIDSESGVNAEMENALPDTEITCGTYRDCVSVGIPVENAEKKISFLCTERAEPGQFSAPSIILFDSYNRRVAGHEKTIRESHYLEYAEIWFDDHMISTAARKIEVTSLEKTGPQELSQAQEEGRIYEITASRFEDHLRLKMIGPSYTKELIIALPDSTKAAYIGLTGEHCILSGITVTETGKVTAEGDIPRIAEVLSYTDHLESDLKNVQIDRTRSASTEGVELEGRIKIAFHTMSLPGANLVWHCPYVVIYHSDDGSIGGENYLEYALIKLNGENDGSNAYAQSRFVMKRTEDFPGWEAWKERNKEGVEYELSFERKKEEIIFRADNLGISIESITTITDDRGKVYAALTGDQVALTDIRVSGE